jgi:heme exporter protein D
MSIGEFLSMGGYGFYVWSSFGMTALLLALEIIYVKRQRRALQQRLRRIQQLRENGNET